MLGCFPLDEGTLQVVCDALSITSHGFRRTYNITVRILAELVGRLKSYCKVAYDTSKWNPHSLRKTGAGNMFMYYAKGWESYRELHEQGELLPLHMLRYLAGIKEPSWKWEARKKAEEDSLEDCDAVGPQLLEGASQKWN